MVTKTKRTKQKSEWDRLSRREQDRLSEEYIYRVVSGKPSRALATKIAKLRGIKLRRRKANSRG